MDFPTTESPVSQIIEKLDSLPNSARDAAVNNSIVLLDNLGGFGESVLKLYSESNPSAREAIAEMFELVCNEPFDNWLDRVERSCDGFSKQKEVVREFDSPPEAIADALDSEGWTVSDDDVRNLGYLEIERETDLTGYDLVLTIDLARQRYGLCQRLDVCSPRSRLQLGSGRGGAYRRGMPGRSLGRPNHRRLQIYL